MDHEDTHRTLQKIALVLEYEGTRYSGFQLQPRSPTIQGELERALTLLTEEVARVYAASRTDAGAHAWGQVVAFQTRATYSSDIFTRGTNFYLPPDIRVLATYQVPDDFHPRRDAYAREYHYRIFQRPVASALLRRYAYHVGKSLNLDAMQKAAQFLKGVRDFSPFSGDPKGRSTVRRLDRLDFREYGDLVTLEMEGNAFLPQQIRRTVGALIQVGLGRLSLEEFQQIADHGQRGEAGPTLPANGLYLAKVRYLSFPPWDGTPITESPYLQKDKE